MTRTLAPALTTSASDRWFTPVDLLADIRVFLGGDFYDPCPARLPGQPITSGLWERWQGQVYCNPPYGRVIAKWIGKALSEPVDELILLVPARTDARWFQPLWGCSLCFIRGRLRFANATHSAPFPSVLAYRGTRYASFQAAFSGRGVVIPPMLEVRA